MAKENDDNSADSLQAPDKSLLSMALIMMIVIAVIAAGWFFNKWLSAPGNFPIRKIELVNQLKQQKRTELQNVAAKSLNDGFFSINVDSFRKEILLLPWIKKVSVRKIWPDKLLVTITERTPLARWSSVNEGSQLTATGNVSKQESHRREKLLSKEGVIFAPEMSREQKIKFSVLPLFSGPDNSVQKVLDQCLQFIKIVDSMNMNIAQCNMDARHAWKIKLASELELNMGKNEVLQRLQRFVQVFSLQLNEYIQHVAYADLRYSNGFSVKWIENAPEKADRIRLN